MSDILDQFRRRALADHLARQRRLEAPPFAVGSDTSQAAAEAIEDSAANLRARVLGFLIETGGATDEEVQLGLDMNPSTVRPRRGELVKMGRVKDSGQRRKTRSGRWAVVWVRV